MAAMNIIDLCFSLLISVYFISLPALPVVEWRMVGRVMKNELKRCEKERSVPNLRLVSANCLMVLKITAKTLARYRKYFIQD
jgi:hypothetical protein